MSKCALLCACGIAASVFAADGVNTGLPVESSFRTGPKQPVQKSDVVVASVPNQRDIDIETAMIARKTAALAQQVARLSTRTAFANPTSPNFFYFNNVAIPLNLKPQMALLINGENNDQKRAIAAQAMANAGIPITPDVSTMSRFVIVNLPQVAQTTEEMRIWIDRVLATGLVSYAAPVFDSEAMADGFRIPTPEILVRIDQEGARAAATPAGVEVLHEQIGPSPGVSQMHSTSRNGFDVMVQANMMQTAAGIRWAHVDFLESLKYLSFIPNDPLFDDQWQLRQTNDIDMDAELAWDFCLGSSSVVTAVMDSGHQLNHPDLNAITGRDFTTGAVNGTGTGAPVDACDNHGTCVAGCISARIDNNLGVAGGAPDTTTMPERVSELQAANCHFFSAYQSSWNINALNYALNAGAKVTNSSYQVGFNQATSDAYSDTGSTMVHCAASGNDGVEGIVFPSSAPLVISCGGFYSTGTRYGNWGTGLDVCAPSVSVYSTDRTGSNGYVNGDYCTVTGTSFASPLTASVAALFRSEFPFATASQTRTSVYLGCVDVGAAGYDTDYGYGRINLYNTLLDRANSNYDCSHATTIPAVIGSYNPAVYSTEFALNKTIEPFESCEVSGVGVSSCVYYKFTPPYTGLIGINTNGSDYDTVLSVFEACSSILGNPTQIACDDDGGTGTQSQLLNVPVTYGNQIIIKVAKWGMSGGGGNLDFNFQYTSTDPTNDTCGTAINIPVSGVSYSYNSPVVDSQLATTSACEDDESCGAANNGHSVWFKFTAPQNGVVNIDTLNSDYDTVLSVFPECAFTLSGNCVRYAQLACNDDSNGGLQSEISNINVVAGADYMIKVSSYNTTAGGGCRLHLTYTMNPPANDDCADATTIPTANTQIQWSSPLINARAATVQSCENTETCGNNNGKSIWWEFTPPRDGHMNLNTVSSTYDTVLSIYTACARLSGTTCQQATLRACNDDENLGAGILTSRISGFAVTGGLTYRFKVGAYNDNAAGDAQLNIQWTADCPADWNNDHSVDFFDYLDFLQAFNSAGLAGDFNDDGVVDFFDYLDFVQSFSGGC